MSRNFITQLFLLIALAISFTGHLLSPIWFTENTLLFINSLALVPLIISVSQSLIKRKISVDFLAISALSLSIYHHEWLSLTFINLMLVAARMLSAYVESKGHSALNALIKMKPKNARLLKNGSLTIIPIDQIQKGDLLFVATGENIPADGIIVEGRGEVNQSFLTGESELIFKKEGDEVLSPTILASGQITFRVEAEGEESTLEKVIKIIKEAEQNKATITGIAEKFASIYISLSIISIILLYIFTKDTKVILSLMLVVCADDIAIAIPLAFTTAISKSAQLGAIVKGGIFIEQLSKVKKIFFDKTGTLTEGNPAVIKSFYLDNMHFIKNILPAIKFMCSLSNHPSSRAIASYLDKEDKTPITDFEEIPGLGIRGKWNEKELFIGRLKYLEDNNYQLSNKLEKSLFNKSNIFIGFDYEIIGGYLIEDNIRKEAKELINFLQSKNIDLEMLTGDNLTIAEKIAHHLEIAQFQASLFPEDKVKIVQSASKQYSVAMVGDGVNDAASLGVANIGIAMGGVGSDITIQTSDIVLVKDNLLVIKDLINIANQTSNIIKENFAIWIIVNIVGIFLVFAKILSPTGAAAYNFLTDFLPLLNALKLFKKY